ncbi:putative polyketide synthase [Aspergillus bombycis]|uniref:Putative polyketide synthase n=1 Tax=Aspergillus bombycis TaxID=109264 RepID=A0A1F7ZV62_9EURO|nr:putative polyketide synthase [Aspergillus bombycis]OGM43340.1 putative polyketide synthase [Aspergillus bombycis]
MVAIYLFGDQTVRVDDALYKLLYVKNNPTLKSFLDDAFAALRKEISSLPANERASLPDAHTLPLLLGAVRNGRRHVALDSALVCLYEIGQYIQLLQTTDLCHPPTGSVLVGFCTGSLAAAAVSCARTSIDLLVLGIEAVVVAFRVGMHVARRANALAGEDGLQWRPWSLAVADMSESAAEKMLEAFIGDKGVPTIMKPYVSAAGSNTVTISGTPKVLEALKNSLHFRGAKSLPVSIYAPYHAAHLYSEADVDSILWRKPTERSLFCRESNTSLISCATGVVLKEKTFGDLLRALIMEILTCQIRFDKVEESIVQHSPDATAQIVPIHTNITSRMKTSLTQVGIEVECLKVTATQGPEAETLPDSPGNESSKIAIIGFSGRFPEADGLDEFWELLQQGLDVHKPIPADRFDREAHYDATLRQKNTSRIKHGCWIRNPGSFDARFFQMSPREACQTDPAQRLALLTAYEAMEMAGFVPDRTPASQRDRVGVYYGMTSDDWREVNSSQDIDTYFIPGGIRAFVPGRLNYFFKFSGPSVTVDTACSSSLAAIHTACSALLNGDCDTAVAGGTNILTNPDNFAGLDRGHFLSSTGNCKTFDDAADGYCRADGVGTVILKRLPDAIADNDPIFGVILGARTSHSAEAVSITRPLADAQAHLFQQLLAESGIHPHEISYIEMHGTGTQAGDAVEMKSVLDSFAWDDSRSLHRPLHLGSVKANVGHGESASGVTALIKVLLMMQKSRIPPHCGIKGRINRHFPTDLEQRNVHIALKETDWMRPGEGKRRSFINNFSAAGGNTAVLVEDAPSLEDFRAGLSSDPRKYHVVTLSARSSRSLSENMRALAEFIGPETSAALLARIGYTTTARRMHHSYRVAFVGDDLQEIKRRLLDTDVTQDTKPCPSKSPGVGFLFTGQGAQQTAMARELYDSFTSFRADIAEFEAISRGHGFPSILPLITGAVDVAELSPIVVQVGTVVVQIAMARLWQNWGLVPQYALGHSLGEYAALQLAGVLSISDTIYLVGSRAALLEKRCTSGSHGMLAVKASISDIEKVLHGVQVEVSCRNGLDDTVLSGTTDEIDRASKILSDLQVTSKKLILPFAFHSSQVDPILDELEYIASQVTYQPPRIPIVSPTLGHTITDEGAIGAQYIRRHCREPVNFVGAVQAAQASGTFDSAGLAVEIGTHPILMRMMKAEVGSSVRVCPTLSHREDTFKTLAGSLSVFHLAGVRLNWDEYQRDFKSSSQVITLPGYSWDYQNHWIQYQNNFCLTKGCPEKAMSANAIQPISTRLSPSVQKIVEEVVDAARAMIIIESDISDPELLPVALDHKVNGVTLCPSSLYADIAHTLGTYLLGKKEDVPDYNIDVCDMVVEKALVVKGTGPQLFRASLDMDWNMLRGVIKVYSVDNTGNLTVQHAQCVIELRQATNWQEGWDRQLYLIQRSIEQLKRGVEEGWTHKMRRGVAYRLFSSMMQYGPSYQAMEEVIFDSSGLEATAQVRLQSTTGQYSLNPVWSDSFGHLTGFVMNCNDSIDLTEHSFVNHGWGFMRCVEPFSPDTVYQTHVKMQPVHHNKGLYVGDVYILNENRIIAHYGAVTFQKVARRVMEMLLPATRPKGGPSNTGPKAVCTSRTAARTQSSSQTQLPQVEDPWQRVLEIIAPEIGVDPGQLTEDVNFTNMGVDSLMSLTIIGKFREFLGLDVPWSLFEDCPSVQSLRVYLNMPSSSESDSGETSSYPTPDGSTTASITSPSGSDRDVVENTVLDGVETTVGLVSSILAEEMGVYLTDLTNADDLSELGLDSLLSLTTLGRVRDETDLELPNDFFLEHTSVASITAALRTMFQSTKQGTEQSLVATHPPATSINLQGNESCSQTLFLFPDGSGSSTSYSTLPAISRDVRVYAMDCPYLKRPNELAKCRVQDLTPVYVAEIRRRQPRGPYNLGGWSAGGIAAYEVAQYLVDQGEKVERLLLIDSPNPMGLGKCPPHFYRFLEEAGVFGIHGGRKPPAWLLQHFQAVNDVLDQYTPAPFRPADAAPRTTIIYAQDGVCKSPGDPLPERYPDDPEVISWLLERRENMSSNGWDQLLGGANIRLETIPDANHFTIVRNPAVSRLAGLVRTAMLQ